jgi:hypothetical protein
VKRTITFYEVKTDPDSYQYLLLGDELDPEDVPAFDGRPYRGRWKPPPVYSFQPRLPEPVFWDFGLGAAGATFAVQMDGPAQPELASYLEPAGELLPFSHDGKPFAVLNVTECIAALDEDASEWLHYDTGERFRVAKPAFRRNRLGYNLFKVPETAFDALYCWEDSADRADQFKAYVEREQLTGLVFEEIHQLER